MSEVQSYIICGYTVSINDGRLEAHDSNNMPVNIEDLPEGFPAAVLLEHYGNYYTASPQEIYRIESRPEQSKLAVNLIFRKNSEENH